MSLSVCKHRVVTGQDKGNDPGCLTCQMKEMLDTLLIFATPHPKVEAINRGESNCHYPFLWSVCAVLVQRDLQVLCKPRIVWKICWGSWDSYQAHFYFSKWKHWYSLLHLSPPIPFSDCVSLQLSMQKESVVLKHPVAVVNYTMVQISACSSLQRLATCLFFLPPTPKYSRAFSWSDSNPEPYCQEYSGNIKDCS